MIEQSMAGYANPVSGSMQSPSWEARVGRLPPMEARHVIARNLKALMKVTPGLDTLPKITAVSGVSNGTLDRMRRAAAAVRVDQLEAVSKAFGLEPWQFMVPSFEPKNPPVLAKASAAERELYAKLQHVAEEIAHYKKRL